MMKSLDLGYYPMMTTYLITLFYRNKVKPILDLGNRGNPDNRPPKNAKYTSLKE